MLTRQNSLTSQSMHHRVFSDYTLPNRFTDLYNRNHSILIDIPKYNSTKQFQLYFILFPSIDTSIFKVTISIDISIFKVTISIIF